MSETETPRVLVVTSAGAATSAVTPILAALEATPLDVRAIDIGRAGGRSDGVLDWVMKPFASDFAERRLLGEMKTRPPDVAVTFDPIATSALSSARDDAERPAPVVAVVSDLEPTKEWAATDADRYLTIDDQAAVALADMGIDGARVLPIGAVCELAFAAAGKHDKKELREKFKLGQRQVVLLHVEGLGYELTAQIVLQLSLVETKALFLFDAGGDAEAATALRRQVPTLGLDAKLFGETEDTPLLWRTADIIVAKPTDSAIARAYVLGAFLVSFMPEENRRPLAAAMEERRRGTIANNALLLSSALEPWLGKRRKKDSLVGQDGAGTAADIAWIVAEERAEVLEERHAAARASTHARVNAAASAAEAAARTSAAAGGLEDLGGGDGGIFAGLGDDLGGGPGGGSDAPSQEELARLKAEVNARLNQIHKTVNEAQQAADRWAARARSARKKGDRDLARKADRQSDRERARMHAALAEMAQMQSEVARLEEAAARAAQTPPRSRSSSARAGRSSHAGRADGGFGGGSIDDELSRMKRNSRKDLEGELRNMKKKQVKKNASLDDELAALKRKMQNKKKR